MAATLSRPGIRPLLAVVQPPRHVVALNALQPPQHQLRRSHLLPQCSVRHRCGHQLGMPAPAGGGLSRRLFCAVLVALPQRRWVHLCRGCVCRSEQGGRNQYRWVRHRHWSVRSAVDHKLASDAWRDTVETPSMQPLSTGCASPMWTKPSLGTHTDRICLAAGGCAHPREPLTCTFHSYVHG